MTGVIDHFFNPGIMIFPALDLIRTELNANGVSSELGNIGEIIFGGTNNNNADIIITLIDVEENPGFVWQ